MQRYQSHFIAFIIAAATLAVFWPVRHYNYVAWDDGIHVYENPYLDNVTLPRIVHFWKQPYAELYIPLIYTSWSVIAKYSRLPQPQETPGWYSSSLNPHNFHTVNLCLHICNALLVFAILRLLVKHDWAAGAGALLFGIHPVQVEPVAWVSGLKDVQCVFFCLLALWQYLSYALAQRDNLPVARWRLHFAAATIAFLLALLSKPSAIAIPFVAWILDYCIVRRPVRTISLALAGWAIMSVLWVPITQFAQPAGNVVRVPLLQRPFIVGDTISFYLGKIILPVQLAVDYGRTPGYVMQHAWYLYWLVPCALAVLAWRWRERWPYLAGAYGIFLAALLPVSGLVPFKAQVVSTVTDRYLYLAMLGPALALAWLVSRCCTRQRAIVPALCVLLLLLFGVQCRLQAQYWQNGIALLEHAVQVNPHSSAAHFDLGVLRYRQGQIDAANQHLRESLRLLHVSLPAQNFIALTELRQGHTNVAIQQLNTALQAAPDHAPLHMSLGVVLDRAGRTGEALAQFRSAEKQMPTSPGVFANLGIVLSRLGNDNQAIACFRKSWQLEAESESPEVLRPLAGGDKAYIAAQQRYIEGVIRHTLRLNPYYGPALRRCGDFLVRAGKQHEAQQFFDKASSVTASPAVSRLE